MIDELTLQYIRIFKDRFECSYLSPMLDYCESSLSSPLFPPQIAYNISVYKNNLFVV